MVLLFQSDASIAAKGFKATYSFIDIKCGGVIKTLGHEIQPPKQLGSLSYQHDSDCVWIIVAPKGFVVQLTFSAFHLEQSSDCSLDSVSLYEGTPKNGTKIQTYCGANLPPISQSSDNILSLKFVSDSSVSGEGFRAQYIFIDSKRGFIVIFKKVGQSFLISILNFSLWWDVLRTNWKFPITRFVFSD